MHATLIYTLKTMAGTQILKYSKTFIAGPNKVKGKNEFKFFYEVRLTSSVT